VLSFIPLGRLWEVLLKYMLHQPLFLSLRLLIRRHNSLSPHPSRTHRCEESTLLRY
jgi:hypothetical protein